MSAFQSACGNNSLCSSTTCRRRSRHARAVAASSNVSAHTGESKPSEEADVALPPASLTFISSVSNPYVKHAVKLGTSRSYREETRSVLLAGGKLLAEVAQECGRRSSGSVRDSLRPRVLLLAEGAPVPDGLAPERVIRASTDVLRKVAGVENGDSTDAVAELPMPPMVTPSIEQIRAAGRVLLLDGVQDPGNVGTLLRTAVAFRWAACALLPGCCDPFNPKAVRAARGACFRLPLWRLASWQQVEQFTATAALDVALLAADPTGDATGRAMRDAVDTCGAGGSLWLALGSEGQGLSDGWQRCCTKIAIPGADGMESLNVGVAGSVLMYALSHPQYS